MSDTTENIPNIEENQQPVFAIQKLYVTDISLESPNTPLSFMNAETEPEFEVHFRNEAKSFDNGFFEVGLTVTAKATSEDKTLFLIELTQAGMFQIANIPADEMDPILGIGCPTVLFPYLREVVSDLTTRAGFPPLLLQPINFEAVFMQQRMAAEAEAEAESIETKH